MTFIVVSMLHSERSCGKEEKTKGSPRFLNASSDASIQLALLGSNVDAKFELWRALIECQFSFVHDLNERLQLHL